MKRKTINIKLSDGKEYSFSERNREDTDFARYHQKIREQNLTVIQNTVKDKDNQLTLMMAEMRRIYTPVEISIYISSSPEEIQRIAYDSFKVTNCDLQFDAFQKLCSPEDARKVTLLLSELEEDSGKKKV